MTLKPASINRQETDPIEETVEPVQSPPRKNISANLLRLRYAALLLAAGAFATPSQAQAEGELEQVVIQPGGGVHLHLGPAYLHAGIHADLSTYRRRPAFLQEKLKLDTHFAFGFEIGKRLSLGLAAHLDVHGKELTPAFGGELQLTLFREGDFSVPLYTSAVFSFEDGITPHVMEGRLLAQLGSFFAGAEGTYEAGHHGAPEICVGIAVGGKVVSFLKLRAGAQVCGEGGFEGDVGLKFPLELEIDVHIGEEDDTEGHHD